ncbi:DUF58 domain-containing protein [Acidaminobacter sp. JC074]|uniref:DUF58 domain-containing protein n=1 Tax=Acidaminobacter sp. JC074 TaxID=2530199 RepID=UPI001F0E3603|nr:DUF58 domain-containing protein [Acidaminobacter sp. JC074]MCH4891360.1 DUF58 domain-containing protein [Acidaminobacter sp. JC074]
MKYLKPTPLKGYGLLVILTLTLIILTGGEFFYFLLAVEITTIVMMYMIVSRNSKKILQFLSIGEDEIEVGDQVRVEVKSNNTSIMPVAHAKIQCRIYNNHNEMVFPSENIFFNPYQITNIRENFEIKTRGIFTTGEIRTDYSDPLRLFRRLKVFEKDIQLVVYPKVTELDYFYMPNTGYIGTKSVAKSGHEDFSSLKKVRKYAPGDSFKKIHWKVSSKRGEMFVKEYEATSSTKMTVFVDAYSGHYEHDHNRLIEDKVVEIAASITKYALKHNDDTSMMYHVDKLVQIESRDLSTFPTVLKELVTFVAKGGITFSELLNQEAKRLEQGSFVVLITTTVTELLIQTLLGLRRRSFEISVIIVSDEETSYDMIQAMGVHIYQIHPEDDLKERLEAFS